MAANNATTKKKNIDGSAADDSGKSAANDLAEAATLAAIRTLLADETLPRNTKIRKVMGLPGITAKLRQCAMVAAMSGKPFHPPAAAVSGFPDPQSPDSPLLRQGARAGPRPGRAPPGSIPDDERSQGHCCVQGYPTAADRWATGFQRQRRRWLPGEAGHHRDRYRPFTIDKQMYPSPHSQIF